MIWESFVANIAVAIGMDVVTCGTFLSLIFSVFLLLCVTVSTKGNGRNGLVAFFVGGLLFTLLGWMHYWVTLLEVLLLVGVFGRRLAEVLT